MDQTNLLKHLQFRLSDNWLIGLEHQTLVEQSIQRWQEVMAWRSIPSPGMVLLAESDPVAFLAGFIAATSASVPLLLGNPNWSEAEWQQVFEQVTPDLIWGTVPFRYRPAPPLRVDAANWILIPTGGSSGKIRFAIHTLETLFASVCGFQNYFGVEAINSCCVLPLYHVSGLMQVLRSGLTGGKLAILPYHQIDTCFNSFDPEHFFLSLVPTQLQRLMDNPAGLAWLKRFQTIFLGGAPAWPALLEMGRSHQLRLAPTYGMTETAAQIATLKPEDFLQGKSGCGQILPHAKIKILTNEPNLSTEALNSVCSNLLTEQYSPPLNYLNDPLIPTGSPHPSSKEKCHRQGDPGFNQANLNQAKCHRIGPIAIQAKSLMLGYFPSPTGASEFITDDLGYIDVDGCLHIVGRSSQKIITGGENVFPAEVEAAVRATGLVLDVCVVGMPDQTWGEAVTAVCVPDSPEVTVAALKAAIVPRLSKFKQPKQWILVNQIPRNHQGKINDAQLKQFLEFDQTQTPLLPQTAP